MFLNRHKISCTVICSKIKISALTASSQYMQQANTLALFHYKWQNSKYCQLNNNTAYGRNSTC